MRKLVTLGLAAALLALPVVSGAQLLLERYVSGEHYTTLEEPVAAAADGEIEAIEFFLYGCSHCAVFDPQVETWAAELPEDVAFRRVPVTFSGLGPLFAKMFYTAKDLGVLESLHSRLFDAIHQQGRDLTNPSAIRKFFVENGVNGADFDASFNSDTVKQQVRQASELMRAYRIDGVPALAVAGKYTTNGRKAGSNDDMLGVADFLINKVRAAR